MLATPGLLRFARNDGQSQPVTIYGGGYKRATGERPEVANVMQITPALVATGNIGCIAQIASGTSILVLHTIELLDFAHGGQPRLPSRAVRLNVISAPWPLARQLSHPGELGMAHFFFGIESPVMQHDPA